MSRLLKESAFCSVASTSQEGLEEEAPTSASNRMLKVTLLSSEWKSSKGGLSTINRELAIQLAKHPNVKVSVYLPQCSEEDKKVAAGHNVQLIEAEELPGLEPVLWLASVPENHAMDCIIGHGVPLGRQIPLIKRQHHCKWIQVVHTAPEDLGMYKSYEEAISKGEQKHQGEVKLCELADQVVAVGPKLADAFSRYLRPSKKDQDVLNLTPSIFNEFLGVEQATEERRTFCVLVFGRGDSEDFKLKGYDVAVEAVAELKDTSYQLMFVGAPAGKEDEVAERLLQHGIPASQLTVRRFNENRNQLAKLFCEVDLAIMPSKTEGFGLTALEALSAGLPVLVSGNSGLGEALKKVATGSQCVVESENPEDWAKKIRAVREKSREVRLAESKLLREEYLKKYRWQESCGFLLEKMQELVFGLSESVPISTKKDKKPLPLFDNQPSKRLRGELMDHEVLAGSVGFQPSSVEHSQLPSMTSQSHGGRNFQRGHIQSSSGHDRPPLSAGYSQLPFTAVTQSSTQRHQTSHTQSFSGWLPSSVEYNQLPCSVASQNYERHSNRRSHAQKGFTSHDRPSSSAAYYQLPFTGVPQSYQNPLGYGSPPSSVRYNSQVSCSSATPAHKEPTLQQSHAQSSFGDGQSPLSTASLMTRFFSDWTHKLKTAAQKKIFSVPNKNTGHGLAVVARIIKDEYNRRSQLKPLLWENTIQLPIKDVYTRLKIVSRRKRDFRLENNEMNMYHIFKDKGDVIVLVEGSPGIGKTTFCLKIAYDWAKEQIPKKYSFPEFEVVLLLKCRDIDGDIMEAIDEQLLPERLGGSVKKEFMDYIEDIHNQEKVLIILDGLDELPKKSESHVDRLLNKKIFPFCYLLVTSRQERGIVVRQKVDFDILLQIEGFTEKDAFKYIRKHFEYAGPEHLPTGERLITQIKENTVLHALRSNPLNLLLLCVVFEDFQGELPSSRTELYQIIVRCLLRRYCAKHNLEAPGDDIALEKQFEDSLLVLGELAWRCLLEDRFSFREEELAKFERKIKDLAARKLGLVFKEASMKRINPQHEYHFTHKTFQEYLAATYLARKLLKEEVNVFRDLEFLISDVVDKYRQVFLFVSGILGENACVLFRQIGETLQSKEWNWLKCSHKQATFFTQSFSESRNAQQMAMTLCSFIPFPPTVEIDGGDETTSASILMVANACRNFPQFQHPVHLTVKIAHGLEEHDAETVADFLASCPKLQTLFFHQDYSTLGLSALFKGLSTNSTISSFTFRTTGGISSDFAAVIGNNLAANKTLSTVTFELINECGEAWASALETGLSADSPLTSVVLKIYGSMSATAIGALKKVLSNRSLTSLTLIIYGEMHDSLATAVGEMHAAESILKSLTLIVCGQLSYSGAMFLTRGFLENSALKSLEVKVFGELPDNWATMVEYALGTKKSFMSVTFHPNIGNISQAQVVRLCPVFELQSLTLNLWGELSCIGAETLCKRLIDSSTSCVTLNVHGKVTDNVANCIARYLKLCKTLTSLSINIWGELTKDGNSALQELSCNGQYSFALNICGMASDTWICKDLNDTIDLSTSLISVFSKVKDTHTRFLSLNISNHGYMDEDWASGLCDGLAKSSSLTTLSLAFNNYSDMSGNWASDLGDGLAKSMSLTTLSLTFNNYNDLSGDWARGLGDGLAKNMSLTTLSLTFSNRSDTSGDLAHDLGDGLAKSMSLTTLSLTLNNYGDMSGNWARGLGHGLAKSMSLTTVSLTFNNYGEVEGYCALGLGDVLAKNTSLTTLSLTVHDYSCMKKDWAGGLADGLAKSTALTTLSLSFDNYSDMGEYRGHGLGDVLAKNTTLTTLSLTSNNYSGMGADFAPGLCYGLANNTSLCTLNLTFNNYSGLSEDWAHRLGNGLAISLSLRTLNLTFNNFSDMTGDWACCLGVGLAENTSLTTVSLTVNNYSDWSEDWVRGFGCGLGGSKSLTDVNVTVTSCSKLSKDWLCDLCDNLAKSDSITVLSFTINDHSGTSEVLGHNLRKHFVQCKSLTSLNVTVNLYGEAVVS